MIVFIEMLRSHWRSTLYWGLGMALMSLIVLSVIPNVDMLNMYADVIENLPPMLLQMTGMGDVSDIATPDGFIGIGYFSRALIIFAVYSVLAGLNITSAEENNGTLDYMLSLPVSRTAVVLGRFAAYALMLLVILLFSFAGFVLSQQLTVLPINLAGLGLALLNTLPFNLFIVALCALIAVSVRRRNQAVTAASVLIFVMYIVDALGQAASSTVFAPLSRLSIFRYYPSSGVVEAGIVWGTFIPVMALALVMIALTVWRFERRDIGI